MPDGKTVYLTDDGTNGVLFMFVASQAGDLSKGTLYAARWNQTSGAGTGSADLDWINLGNTSDKEVKQAIKDGVVFSDLFDVDTPACKWIGANGVAECLEVKPGKELLASRLESRRFAALRGGTHEFRKMEGFTFNPARDQAYIAISEVARGMLEMDSRDYLGQMDIVTGDHIRLAQADYCGAVYSMDLASGRDTTIALPRWARNKEVIAHEVAHWLAFRECKSLSGHGGVFMGYYLKLLHLHCGYDLEVITQSAKDFGLRVISR